MVMNVKYYSVWRQLFFPISGLCLSNLGLLCCLHPVAGDIQLQDDAVVNEAVDGRRRDHRVLEDHVPLRERQV